MTYNREYKRKKAAPGKSTNKGVVTYFNGAKQFAFIEDSDSNERLFVHQSSSSGRLKQGVKVVFEIQKGPGGLKAVNVSNP